MIVLYVLPKFGVVRHIQPLRTVVWLGLHFGILNSSGLLSQPVQLFSTNSISEVGFKARLAKLTQIFRPSSPNFYRGEKVRKFTK